MHISILKFHLKMNPSKASSFLGGTGLVFFTISIPGEMVKFNIVVWDVDFNNAIWIEGLQKIRGIFPKLSKVKLPEFDIKVV